MNTIAQHRESRRVRAGAPAPDFRFETFDERQERVIHDFEHVDDLPFQRTLGALIWIGGPLATLALVVYVCTR